MFCKNCGSEVPVGVAFCPTCGTPSAVPVQENQIPLSQQKANVFCPGCGQMVAAGATVCDCCGTPLAPVRVKEKNCPGCGAPVPADAQICGNCGASIDQKSDSILMGKLKKYWWAVAAGVAVIAFLIVGFATNWFSGGGAADAVWEGAQKTVMNDNFTADITYSIDGYSQKATIMGDVDEDDEKVTLYGVADNGQVVAIHDDYAITGNGYRSYADDISYELSTFFTFYNMVKDGIDLKDLITEIYGDEEYYEMMSQSVDMDALEDFLDTVWDHFNDTAWLEENAGFSQDGDTYTFKPNLYKLACAIIEDAKDFFENEADYETVMEELEYMRDELEDAVVKLQYTIEDGNLTKLVVSFNVDGESGKIAIDFYDIGSTEIDIDALDELLEEALW